MALPEKNYVHDGEIWRQRLKNEQESAAAWFPNHGYLAEHEHSEPRGFSKNVAKYVTRSDKWSVKTVRVADNTNAGQAAAASEQEARKRMSTLKFHTAPAGPTKHCEHKGTVLIEDEFRGVESKDAALALRAHTAQFLGDACRTTGVDPHHKYGAPVTDSHEYGWRVPTATNGRPTLELFGVGDHNKMDMRKTLHDMVP